MFELKKLLTSWFLALSISVFGQVNYYQDICNCGITGGGFSTGMSFGSGQVQLYIEPGSLIKKAFLFAHRYGEASDAVIDINSISYNFSELTQFGPTTFSGANWVANEHSAHVIDITNSIDPSVSVFNVSIPNQISCSGCSFNNIYILVIYENTNITQTLSYNIVLNDKNEAQSVNYSADFLNVINLLYPIGFACYTDRLGDNNDGSSLLFQNGIEYNVGTLKGSDSNSTAWYGAGVKGHFYYQNNILYGLSDDTPDNLVSNSDGLLDVQNYLNPDNSLHWTLEWEIPSAQGRYNIYNGFFLTHSTPCDTFSVTTTSDTSICQGQTLQLFATGGQTYEWLPATNLSCTDCPNPIFTGDSSQYYTVRIWNNDSCSVVRPVKINVRPKPQFGAIGINPSLCGTNSGIVNLSAASGTAVPLTYSMNGTTPESLSVFDSLLSGTYTFTLTDAYSCSNDTLLTITQVNNTVAQFTVNPSSGNVPLTVLISNESLFASNFSWSLNGLDQGATFSSFTCDTSGIYSIQLIAYQYDPSCADTFSLSVIAQDELIIPTAFTPDNDDVNDTWKIPNINTIYPKHRVQIYDRWGLLLFESVEGKYENNPWKGFYKDKTLPVGTYYFIIDPNDGVNEEVKGIVSIVKW